MGENKPFFIVDASVLIKWVIKEADFSKEAFSLREDFRNEEVDIAVPTHCLYEIANTLSRSFAKVATSFLSFFLESEIEEHHLSSSIINKAFLLIEQYSHITFYDASYHALAIQKDAIFITADEKYYRKTHKEGHIMLLKDYGKKR